MKTIAEVLERKERELQRLQTEIDALRLAARLLSEDDGAPAGERPVEVSHATVGTKAAGAEKTSRQFP